MTGPREQAPGLSSLPCRGVQGSSPFQLPRWPHPPLGQWEDFCPCCPSLAFQPGSGGKMKAPGDIADPLPFVLTRYLLAAQIESQRVFWRCFLPSLFLPSLETTKGQMRVSGPTLEGVLWLSVPQGCGFLQWGLTLGRVLRGPWRLPGRKSPEAAGKPETHTEKRRARGPCPPVTWGLLWAALRAASL